MAIYSVKNEITKWDNIISQNNSPEIVESAFFNIYIQLEVYLREKFIFFSLGNSIGTYTPDRKLNFSSEIQLADIIKGDNKFVDYFEAIKRCGNHIFNKNPFNLIFDSTNYSDDLPKMKYIRDYLAHRSSESKNRYINRVLNTFGIQAFVVPGDFLIKKRKMKNESYYTKFCNEITEIDDILNNDILLNGI